MNKSMLQKIKDKLDQDNGELEFYAIQTLFGNHLEPFKLDTWIHIWETVLIERSYLSWRKNKI